MYDNDAMVRNQTLYTMAKNQLRKSHAQGVMAAIHLVASFEFKQILEFKAKYSTNEWFHVFE
jgi:hypothetical protein